MERFNEDYPVVLIAIVIVIIIVVFLIMRKKYDRFTSLQDYHTWNMDVHEGIHRLYSTADVDPLVTGQLYQYADYIKPMYAERVSHSDKQGLVEYNSSGGSGDPGVNVGPLLTFDDGIPEEWQMPSTPVQWYRPKQRDYYGNEGPTVYDEGLFALTQPDHDPLM